MKRIFVIMILCVLLTGCSAGKNDHDFQETSNGTVSKDEAGAYYILDKLPFDMDYNGTPIKFLSVDLYQDKVEYSYNMYAVVTMDTGELTDEDLYWIDKNEEIEPEIYITNKDNGFKSMSKLCTYDNNGIRKVAFEVSGENRYSFNPSDISVTIDVDSKETYKCKDGEFNKHDLHSYDIDTYTNFKPSNTIDHDLYKMMILP